MTILRVAGRHEARQGNALWDRLKTMFYAGPLQLGSSKRRLRTKGFLRRKKDYAV